MSNKLTNNDFLVLRALKSVESASQRQLAAATGLSLGTVNTAVHSLSSSGMTSEGRITDLGIQALEPHRVDNAIILAAGLSSRFAPISYEKPKGLLKVRGEILIERQIKQLREAGVEDITVVVGYRKEYFFYLRSKFGVRIVVNDEYADKNNHASLWLVRNRLANTYICSSDDYFTQNPFASYEYGAYYSAQWAEGQTAEWCMNLGPKKKITGVRIGGHDAWFMLGHAYFDKEFSARFSKILEEEYTLPETKDKLWESLFIKHVDEFDMVAKPYPEGFINEFDTLAELRAFDPDFIENVDSEIFDNIVSVLHCDRSEIRDIWALKQGLTNLSCHFATDEGEWVYRHPGVGTELLVDRQSEVEALGVARELGLDKTFVFADPKKGWKISHFVTDAKNPDPHNSDDRAIMMRMARELHESDASVSAKFDFYDEAKRYESLMLEKGPIDIPGYAEMAAKIDELAELMRNDNAPTCLCHNDFFLLNFLVDADGKYNLIDWEYAGMGDYANDFGTFCVCCQLDKDEIDSALTSYFDRTPTAEETRHNYALIVMAGWCWYLWSLLKEAEGDHVGEWLYIYYGYAEQYLDSTLELYKKGE